MIEWQFQRLTVKDGLTQATLPRVYKKCCVYALNRAFECTMASPAFSGHTVSGGYSSITSFGDGATIEYGLNNALPPEVFLAAVRHRSDASDQNSRAVIALVFNESGEISTPAGDSRDFLLDLAAGDSPFDLVLAARDSHLATVVDFQELLFDDYKFINPRFVDHGADNQAIFHECWRCSEVGDTLVNDSCPSSKFPMRKYHAAIIAASENYSGAHITDFGHPIYALQSACLELIRHQKYDIQRIVITCEGDGTEPPHVLYRDRHFLLQVLNQAEQRLQIELNPSVHLCTYKGDTLTGFWKTSARAWFPLPGNPLD